MSLSYFLKQCPAYLVRQIWMVLEMGGRWPYNCCFVGCCFQDLFNIAHNILVQLPFSFFYIRSSIIVHAFACRVLMSFSVDETIKHVEINQISALKTPKSCWYAVKQINLSINLHRMCLRVREREREKLTDRVCMREIVCERERESVCVCVCTYSSE